ncbi:MAG: 3-hydroxy-9,10-secoandrosta,3,5(10)-triene-9,17-dione monooxygenase [Pseudonocardia sp.]
MLLLPASELTVRDTWFAAGVRATASNTFVGEEVFVPEHRVIPTTAPAEGHDPDASGAEGLYLSPFNPVGVPALLAPMLGICRAALAWTTEQACHKGVTHTMYSRQADAVNVQVQIAQAALKIETARLHV